MLKNTTRQQHPKARLETPPQPTHSPKRGDSLSVPLYLEGSVPGTSGGSPKRPGRAWGSGGGHCTG